ncbi:MAG: YfiR family protein [Telluria sp.]
MHSDAPAQLRVRRMACLAAALPALWSAPAVADPVPESAMNAAFVFNFAVFAEWPQEVLPAGAPLRLCATQGTALFAALDQLNDKLVNGHRIALRQLQGTSPRSCHLVVLGSHDRDRWPQMRRELSGASVLTVSDDSTISSEGAMIGLSSENERIGFDVDMSAARAARLSVSSKLLRLARTVR